MIAPTNGRIVWFYPTHGDKHIKQRGFKVPLAASVCHVWNDRCVNLDVIDSDGQHWPQTSVILLQDDDLKPEGGRFAVWMPYQIGQAKKHEADPK